MPALLLDDGTVIAESIAICRYFEALQPHPVLFGQGALESALVEMWNRRVELNLLAVVANVFRHLNPAMKEMEKPQVAAWGRPTSPGPWNFWRFSTASWKTAASSPATTTRSPTSPG